MIDLHNLKVKYKETFLFFFCELLYLSPFLSEVKKFLNVLDIQTAKFYNKLQSNVKLKA